MCSSVYASSHTVFESYSEYLRIIRRSAECRQHRSDGSGIKSIHLRSVTMSQVEAFDSPIQLYRLLWPGIYLHPAMPEPAYQDDNDDDAIPNFIEIDLVGGTQMTHREHN